MWAKAVGWGLDEFLFVQIAIPHCLNFDSLTVLSLEEREVPPLLLPTEFGKTLVRVCACADT